MAKTKRKAGRPKKNKDELIVPFGIRISKSLRESVDKLAAIGNRRPSDEARQAIENHVAANEHLLK